MRLQINLRKNQYFRGVTPERPGKNLRPAMRHVNFVQKERSKKERKVWRYRLNNNNNCGEG
jgi:hypothetical protein